MKNRDRNLKCYRKDQRSNISNTLYHKYSSILLAQKICLQMCFQNHNPPILEVTIGFRDPSEGLRFYIDQCLCISIWKSAFERLQNRKKSYRLLLQYKENSSKLGRVPADTHCDSPSMLKNTEQQKVFVKFVQVKMFLVLKTTCIFKFSRSYFLLKSMAFLCQNLT